MKTNFYIAINARGTARLTNKNKPALAADEVSVYCKLEIPDSAFQKPQFTATLRVSESAVSPQEIAVETLEDLRQTLETATGFHVTMSLAEAPK